MAEFQDFLDPVTHLGAEPVNPIDIAGPGEDILPIMQFLQVEADSAGLTGYQFEAFPLSEMNRLRAYLFELAGWTGPGSALASWALVSDRYLLSASPSLNVSTAVNPFTGAPMPLYRDVRAIVEAGATIDVASEVTHSRVIVHIGPASAERFGSVTVDAGDLSLLSGSITFQFEPYNNPPPMPTADQIVGDRGLFSEIVIAGAPGSAWTMVCTINPALFTSPITLDYEYRNTEPDRRPLQVRRTIDLRIGRALTTAEYSARVISRDGSEWQAFEIPDVNVTTSATSPALTVQSTIRVNGGNAYWSARMGPVGIIGYASYASASELWNRQQWNDAANFPDAETPPIGATTRPRTLITSEPLPASMVRSWQPPAAVMQTNYPDATRAAAAWPDYYEIAFTVPAELKTGKTFTFSPYRWHFAGELQIIDPDRCSYYEIPLEATPELERFTAWNNFDGDRETAKTHQSAEASGQVYADGFRAAHGTQAHEHFHDQKIVTADGSTFWYRDAFTVLPADLVEALRRFPAWTIERDGDAFTLYLLVPEHDIVVGYQIDGTPITQAATYWPSGRVTPQEYREHYLRHTDIFVGTWPDFTAPYRFFSTALDGPIAGWTMEKNIGGAWVPGQELKIYLPRSTARTPASYFHPRRQTALDANIAITQSLALPGYAGPSGSGEIHNVQIRRQKRKFATLVFRNRQCTIATEALDLRLFVPVQRDGESKPPLYDQTEVEGWRDLSFSPEQFLDGRGAFTTIGNELNFGDYYFNRDTKTIHLNKTDALPDDGDEFLLVSVSFEADSSSECILQFGQLIDGTVPEVFEAWREMTINPVNDGSEANFYANSHEQHVTETNPNGRTLSPKWIVNDVWPLAYQRMFQPVTVGATQTDYTYTVPASDGYDHSIDGKLVQITAPEDATLTHEIGWRAKIFCTYSQVNEKGALFGGAGLSVVGQLLQSSELCFEGVTPRYQNQFFDHATGEQLTPVVNGDGTISLLTGGLVEPSEHSVIRILHDRYATTETNVLGGTHYLHPKTARTTEADHYGRVFHFRLLSARQNWRVDVAWREIFPDPVVQPEIVGIPFAGHFNETLRLLKGWVAAGMP